MAQKLEEVTDGGYEVSAKAWRLLVCKGPEGPVEWGIKGEFVVSLGTGDLRTAQSLRDRYVTPLLAESRMSARLNSLDRAAKAASESVAQGVAELRPNLSGSAPKAMTLRELGDRFITYLRLTGSRKPSSIGRYVSDLNAAYRLLGGDRDAERLGKQDVVYLRDTLLELPASWQRLKGPVSAAQADQKRLSARSVDRILMRLKRVYRWAIDEERLERTDNPFDRVGVITAPVQSKRAPTLVEADALIALPQARPFDSLTWQMMPLLARYTGCRAGELAQPRPEDVPGRRSREDQRQAQRALLRG